MSKNETIDVRKRGSVIDTFTYRGLDCTVVGMQARGMDPWVNGYMTGDIDVESYDQADQIADAHGGFTYFHIEDDHRVTLGFDTAHGFDSPDTQNREYVVGAIRSAVDSLHAAGVIKGSRDYVKREAQ